METIKKKKGPKKKPKIQAGFFDSNNITQYWRDQQPHSGDGLFTDTEFPPEERSILAKDESGNFIDQDVAEAKSEKMTDPNKVEWKRIGEIFEKSVIFEEYIECDDINQGSLGNCYFLSTLSALTEFPHLIYQVFRTKEKNDKGYFEIVMFIDGKWQVVIIDDYFVMEKGQKKFSYAKPNGFELWVIILEKAWAKVNGGYANTISGNPKDVMMAFTGFSVEDIRHKEEELEDIWEAVVDADKKNYVMCTSTCTNLSKKDYDAVSLVKNHAYTLIGAKEGTFDGERIRLVNLRNPWGRFEWNVAYSEKSDLWTDEKKAYFNIVDEDDGSFMMTIEDFKNYFSETDICNVLYDGYVKNFKMEGEENLTTPQVFNFYTAKKCQLNVSALFRFWRFNRDVKKSVHPISIIIAKYNKQGELSGVKGAFSIDSDPHLAKEIDKGYYVVLVYCSYDDCTEPKHESYQIRFFCDNEFKLVHVGNDSKFCLIRDMMRACVQHKFEKEIKEDKDQIYFKQLNQIASSGIGLYYLQIDNPDKCSTVDCVNSCQNMRLLPPWDLPLEGQFKFSVPSGGNYIVLGIRIKNGSYMCYMKPTRHTYKGANKDLVEDNSWDEYNKLDFLSTSFKKDVNDQFFYDYHSVSFDEATADLEFESIDVNQVELDALKRDHPTEMELLFTFPSHESIDESDLKWIKYNYGKDGDYYVGQFTKGNQREGRGYYYWVKSDQYYCGYWIQGKKEIRGMINIKGKPSYEGAMVQNNKEGIGKCFYPGGDVYDGEFHENQLHGKGVYTWGNGANWDGTFEKGKFNGKGTYYNTKGKKSEREYKNSKIVK